MEALKKILPDYKEAMERVKEIPSGARCLDDFIDYNLGTKNHGAAQISSTMEFKRKFHHRSTVISDLRKEECVAEPTIYEFLKVFGECKGVVSWYLKIGQLDYLLRNEIGKIHRGKGGAPLSLTERLQLASEGKLDGQKGYTRFPFALVMKDGKPTYWKLFEIGVVYKETPSPFQTI